MVKKLLSCFLFLILIFPYLLLFKGTHFVDLNWNELGQAFVNTLLQSILSTSAVIVLGMWAALGLCYLSSLENYKNLKYFQLICLVPSFLPSLFFVTAILQILRPFPFGILGITIIHTLTYTGLTALMFQTTLENKFYNLSEQAYLEGASQKHFLRAVIINMPFEILMFSLFLFVQFFTSFSVPLLVGMKRLTVETLIYEKIRIAGDLSGAMLISLLESIFITAVLLFYRSQIKPYRLTQKKLYILKSKFGLSVIILPVALFLIGSLFGSGKGIEQLLKIEGGSSIFLPLILRSVGLSLFSGFALIVSLSAIAYVYKNHFFDKFLLSFIPLSTILIGLSLLLVSFHAGFIEQDLKVVLAMLILFLPVLYRFELKTRLHALDSQIETAQLMGAKDFFLFKKIIYPQVFPSVLFLSGLGAFWTIGDFAISQIIYGKDITLALYIQSLVGSYRLELANLFVLILLVLGLLVFTMFKEMKHVISQKY
jgi:ABC-type Fe3+ transport system permease subunit